MTIIKILMIISFANLIYNLTEIVKYCFDQSKRKKTDKHYISEYIRYDDGVSIKGTMNNQIVYKVDGDFNGDIKGGNVTVILMGDGNFNGNIKSKDGNVVLIKGNINGDVKANKVVCPNKSSTDKWIAPPSFSIDLKCPSCNQIYTQELNTSVKKTSDYKYVIDITAPYSDAKTNKETINNNNQHICKSCYHYVQTPFNGSYCTKDSPLGEALPEGCSICKSYDGIGETTNYKSDCTRFSNRSGICHFFHVNTCAIEHNCPYKIKRDECKTDSISDNIAKHNPAKDVESPKLPVKTLWSCDIPSNNNKCSKCAFAKKMPYLSLSGINTDNEYNCLKFNKIVDSNYCCRDFIDLKTVGNLNNRINDIINRK